MKSLVKISILAVIIVLSSCQTMRWGNFNKQKFTNLKPVKTERKNSDEQNNEPNEGVKNSSDEENNENTPQLIIFENDDSTKTNENTESSIDVEEQITYAFENGYEIIIKVNGRDYYLDKKSYNEVNQTLYGDLIGIENLPKNSKVLDLKAGEYDIIRMNTLKVELDQITVITEIEIPVIKEPETIAYEEKTEVEGETEYSETKVEDPNVTIEKSNSKKSIALVIFGILIGVIGFLTGGLILGVCLVLGILFVIIGASISFKNENKKVNDSKRSNNSLPNVSSDQLYIYKKKALKQFLGSLVCLGFLIIGILVGLWYFELFGLVLSLLAWFIGFPLLSCSALNSRRYRLSCKAKGQDQSDSVIAVRVFTWIGLFIFGSIPFLIPFFISLGVIQSKTR